MRLIKVAVALSLFTLGTQAHASSAAGYVKNVAYTGTRVFVWIDAVRNGPSCNIPAAGDRYELNGGTTEGQTQLSIILTALSLRKQVTLIGAYACPIDTETISFLQINP